MAHLVPQISPWGGGALPGGQLRRSGAPPLAAFRPGQQPPRGLILPNTVPGRSVGGGSGPQIIIPGENNKVEEAADRERIPPNRYRPPAGFIDDRKDEEAVHEETSSPEVLLSRLRSGAGEWHELVGLFEPLQAQGIDSSAIEDATGLPRKVHSRMRIAGDVLNSLRGGAISDDALAFFDADETYYQLYHLRFLAVEQ